MWLKRGEVGREWRKLHKEELHGLCSKMYTVRVSKSWAMKWAGGVARMGEGKGTQVFGLGTSL